MTNENEDLFDDSDVDSDDDEIEAVAPKTPKSIKGKDKTALIISMIKAIVISYGKTLDFKLNLRMLHYRLVEHPALKGKGIFENTLNQYKWLSNCIAEARRRGDLPWEIFQDKTRTVPTVKSQDYTEPERSYKNIETDLNKIIESNLRGIGYQSQWYSLPASLYQPDLTVIMLEKLALEDVFKSVIDDNKAILVVNKGYNSLSQLKDFSDVLKQEKRGLHLMCFSDFDPTGLDIQRNFIDQMKELGVTFASIERVALTEELITKHALPYAPPKKTDARAKNWSATGVVELDALDPLLLQDLIKDCIKNHWNEDIAREVKRLEAVLKKRIKRECDKKIAKIRSQIAS